MRACIRGSDGGDATYRRQSCDQHGHSSEAARRPGDLVHFIDALAAICRDCKVPASLAEVGVREADLTRLAEDAMKQTRLLVNNSREITYQDAYTIYSEALDGRKRQAA